jgi:hypothetical protein
MDFWNMVFGGRCDMSANMREPICPHCQKGIGVFLQTIVNTEKEKTIEAGVLIESLTAERDAARDALEWIYKWYDDPDQDTPKEKYQELLFMIKLKAGGAIGVCDIDFVEETISKWETNREALARIGKGERC